MEGMLPAAEVDSNWQRSEHGEEADTDLVLDLTMEGGEFLGSGDDFNALNSFHTARSCFSCTQGYDISRTIPSDLVPNVTLILPPCANAGKQMSVDVHIEHPVSTDGSYRVVCMTKGLHVASVGLTPSDGLSVRMRIPQLMVGLVDIFVSKSSSNRSSYTGGPGHLLVLPEAEARDANAMFTKLVTVALEDPIETNITAPISEEQETVAHRSRSCEALSGANHLIYSGDFPQGTEDIPEPSVFGGGFHDRYDSSGTSGMIIELPGSLRNMPSLLAPFRTLDIQKWVWSDHFSPFALELAALLQTVARPPPGAESDAPSTSDNPLLFGPVFVEVLENILVHMKKFDAWELISFIMEKSIGAGINIFWEGKKMNRELLTGQRLKELARDPAVGAILLDDDGPGPSGLQSQDPAPSARKRREPHLVASATTCQRGKQGLERLGSWSGIRIQDTREAVGPLTEEKKPNRRFTRLIRKLSKSIKSIHHHIKIEKRTQSLIEPQEDSLPTVESGQNLDVAPREDSASRTRSLSKNKSKRRSKAWESIRRRFFKTDSANTGTNLPFGSSSEQPLGQKSVGGQLRKRSSSEGMSEAESRRRADAV